MSVIALDACLEPLQAYMSAPGVSEISINKPGEVWIERAGVVERQLAPELDLEQLETLALLIGQATNQHISRQKPLLAGYTPQQFRVQVVHHPAVLDVIPPSGDGQPLVTQKTVSISIRLPTILTKSLTDYRASGSFRHRDAGARTDKTFLWRQLDTLKRRWETDSSEAGQQALEEFFRLAVRQKLNILVSGGTSTGKTTFLNALLTEVDPSERLVTIEDVPELVLYQPNTVRLVASKGEQGVAKVSVQDLLEASLRMRPDRIVLGEIRGAEAFPFLSAINSGHPGSVCSIHADSPELALPRLAFCVLQARSGLEMAQIVDYIKSMIQIVVHVGRDTEGGRYIEDVRLFEPTGHAAIQTVATS